MPFEHKVRVSSASAAFRLNEGFETLGRRTLRRHLHVKTHADTASVGRDTEILRILAAPIDRDLEFLRVLAGPVDRDIEFLHVLAAPADRDIEFLRI